MLRRFARVGLLFCVILAGSACFATNYWVSVGSGGYYQKIPVPSSSSVYLIEMDQFGNVLRGPTEVVSGEQFGKYPSRVTAIANKDQSTLFLWVLSGYGEDALTAQGFPGFPIHRVLVNKNSMTGSAVQTIMFPKDAQYLQASQAGPLFLAAQKPYESAKGFFLTANGMYNGASVRLNPRVDEGAHQASVSADGRVCVAVDDDGDDRIYYQRLATYSSSPPVRPIGAPVVVASRPGTLEALDVTGPLAGGKRFVVYVEDEPFDQEHRGPSDRQEEPDDITYLQVVTEAGQKLGKPIVVNIPSNRTTDPQSLAIDPDGTFVLLTLNGDDYGCPYKDLVVYQALDATGHPTGPLKQITSCDTMSGEALGIDILKQ